MRVRDLLIAASLALAPAMAYAHPHEWVDVASEVLFDDKGQIVTIRHHWRFDEAFSAFALQGLDSDGDGAYSQEELQPLAQVNVESLGDYSFFTFVSVGDYQAGYGAPKDYHLDLAEDRLTLHYTLPLAQPLFTRGEVLLQVYDPEYYIAFALPSAEAVRLVDAPAGCRLAVYPAGGPDPAAAAALATIGAEQRELPDEMQSLAMGIDNSAEINCGGPTMAAEEQQAAPRSASEAADMMAGGGAGEDFDLSAMPAEPSAPAPALLPEAAPPAMPDVEPAVIASAEEPVPLPGEPLAAPAEAPNATATPAADAPGLYARFLGRVSALQTAFNRDLTEALKGVKSDGSVFWWLGGISFLYGIVHAAGPGHGKVVISSYLVANEQRLRRGVVIAFLSALMQALVAVGIVGLMAMLLNMTSIAMTDTAKILETGSFALVAGLGIYLLMAKGRQAWTLLHDGKARAHNHSHDHNHVHRHDLGAACTCTHHAAPAVLEKRGAAGAIAAVLSVGIRPCSGALIVLVFALAQGIFWAGVASTFMMALGTAITVAALAALAVGAKDIALRLSQGDGRRSATIMLSLEVAAAVLITALGVVLFAGSLST